MTSICVLAPFRDGETRLPPDYPGALRAAGAEPFVITQKMETPPEEAAARCAGLLLIGGYDVNPALYGHAAHPETAADVPGRDEAELALYRAFRRAKKPVLGICRGIQLINVAEGGTLHQHLPDLRWLKESHSGAEVRHDALLAPGTRLWRIFGGGEGGRLRVNSRHHQAIDRAAPGFAVCAVSAEGLPEAIEAPGVLAVQWHPENLGLPMQPLFRDFVARAAGEGTRDAQHG